MVDKNYTPKPGEAWAKDELLPAEAILLKKAKTGDTAEISAFKPALLVPWRWTGKHKIRAKVIRHLLRHPTVYDLDPKGVDIDGAHITGYLDLGNLKIQQQVQFGWCLFNEIPVLQNARLRTVAFHASRLPGLMANGLNVQGSLFLRHSLFTGEVNLLGARVTGSVGCTGATFTPKGEIAISADRICVGGSLFLTNVTVTGEMRLLGAQMTGSVTCTGATFTHKGKKAFNAGGAGVGGDLSFRGVTVSGETALLGAQVTGDVNCAGATFANPNGDAFNAQRLTVTGRLFCRDMGAQPDGGVDFNHARVGDFIDDEQSWSQAGKLVLDGFVYDNLTANTSATQRIRWLALMPATWGGEPAFWPQPYEQLIKVFKAAGHERDARLVAMKKQDAYRRYLRAKAQYKEPIILASGKPNNHYMVGEGYYFLRLWLWFLNWTAGYGYAPWRAFIVSAIFIGLGAIVFEAGYANTKVLPAKELAYINKCYAKDASPIKELCKEANWSKQSTRRFYQPEWLSEERIFHLPTDYVTFQPLAYSMDVFIPILDLQQETSWMPKTGWFRAYMWFHIVMGWVLTTIAVAGFSGLIKKD